MALGAGRPSGDPARLPLVERPGRDPGERRAADGAARRRAAPGGRRVVPVHVVAPAGRASTGSNSTCSTTTCAGSGSEPRGRCEVRARRRLPAIAPPERLTRSRSRPGRRGGAGRPARATRPTGASYGDYAHRGRRSARTCSSGTRGRSRPRILAMLLGRTFVIARSGKRWSYPRLRLAAGAPERVRGAPRRRAELGARRRFRPGVGVGGRDRAPLAARRQVRCSCGDEGLPGVGRGFRDRGGPHHLPDPAEPLNQRAALTKMPPPTPRSSGSRCPSGTRSGCRSRRA